MNSGACVNLRHEHGRSVLLHAAENSCHNAENIIVERAGKAITIYDPAPAQHQVRLLYGIRCKCADYQEFELEGHYHNRLPRSVRMHRDWAGSWKIRYNHVDRKSWDYVFRTTAD